MGGSNLVNSPEVTLSTRNSLEQSCVETMTRRMTMISWKTRSRILLVARGGSLPDIMKWRRMPLARSLEMKRPRNRSLMNITALTSILITPRNPRTTFTALRGTHTTLTTPTNIRMTLTLLTNTRTTLILLPNPHTAPLPQVPSSLRLNPTLLERTNLQEARAPISGTMSTNSLTLYSSLSAPTHQEALHPPVLTLRTQPGEMVTAVRAATVLT